MAGLIEFLKRTQSNHGIACAHTRRKITVEVKFAEHNLRDITLPMHFASSQVRLCESADGPANLYEHS